MVFGTVTSNYKVNKYWASADLLFLCQKHNVGWFQLKGFIDLLRICSLQIHNTNHSNMLLFNNLKKMKKLVQSKIL